MLEENLIKIYEASFRENREMSALTDYFKNETFSYYEMAKEIAKLHLLFKKAGIKQGDKIALIGRNNPRWCITYIATITYGAVIVPILQDFTPADVTHIINHSESRLLFLGDNFWDVIDEDHIRQIEAVFSLTDFHVIFERNGKSLTKFQHDILKNYRSKYPRGFSVSDIKYPDIPNDRVILLNYTSGTTGYSKGVMLTVNNLTGNVLFAKTALNTQTGTYYFQRGGRTLSFLPLAHAYGCAFDFLAPLAVGGHVTLLGRIPSPKILIEAMAVVKPTIICCVPMILEKIYRKQVLPMLEKGPMSIAMKIPLLNTAIYSVIRKKLMDAFGGNVTIFIVGGAPMNQETESFLMKIHFPITIGYGMTECAPLISFTPDNEFKPSSCGRYLKGLLEVRIESSDPEHVAGEIFVRGEHVMKGYYKNEKDTQQVLDDEGVAPHWRHGHDGPRRHALHPRPVEDDDPLGQRTEHLPRGDRGQTQQHVYGTRIARARCRQRPPAGPRGAGLRTGRRRGHRQVGTAADHAEQPAGAQQAAGRLRTRLGHHDLPHRVREDPQAEYQAFPLQRLAARQLTPRIKTRGGRSGIASTPDPPPPFSVP